MTVVIPKSVSVFGIWELSTIQGEPRFWWGFQDLIVAGDSKPQGEGQFCKVFKTPDENRETGEGVLGHTSRWLAILY